MAAESFRHVVSLGCRCSQASVYRDFGQRRYACPFDWIFSSAKMVAHCLQNDFKDFLDRHQYFENAAVFDAVGLKPGSAPRERKLIGHQLYSTMTGGVGRGTIFNHRDPLHNDEDYLHMVRCVERFRLVLASEERKLFVMLNLNKQLWLEQDLLTLFEELRKHTTNFLFLVVDCSWKNLGESSDPQLLNEIEDPESHARLVMYRLPCAGDNTGSYFRNEADAQGVKSLLLEPFRFDLAIDPLDQSQTELPDATQGYTRRSAVTLLAGLVN
ncbi:Uncharacterized protein SCF082_LOCUS53025 [Durusdinium trenchii]|uniref:Uncharacterized protein n=1 Tax=Durusdinium trenchii TaxID=1381693 RepID=A0ABP0SPX5_9DINO